MPIISIASCEAIPPVCIMNMIDKIPKGVGIWKITNEIKPSDLYCYLYAKFGAPNGIQNILREDNSDNMIHWDWTLAHANGLLMIFGMNMRTEIHLIGKDWDFENCSLEQFITHIKEDFSNYGKQMSSLRSQTLEDWDLFVNPFRLLEDAIMQLKNDLDNLSLNPEQEKLDNLFDSSIDKLTEIISKYNRGIGLAIALRTMTPILAESFINFLLFMLCIPDIKKNERLYTSAIRANIDVRVQSLHINCIGFDKAIDWKSPECSRYNSIVNERNDMLHGNIDPNKLKFSEIYFLGKVPIFKKYEDFWQQSIGVSINKSGLDKVMGDLEVVDNFIKYVLSCLNPDIRRQVEVLINRRDIGINKKNDRLGALLPEYIVDFKCE